MQVGRADRIVIFGGGGFIGSHLVKGLVDNGYRNVVCLDLEADKLTRIVPAGGYEFLQCDISANDQLIRSVIQEGDLVIDLVAYANPIIYLERPLEVVELNLFDNLKIVDYCVEYELDFVQE